MTRNLNLHGHTLSYSSPKSNPDQPTCQPLRCLLSYRRSNESLVT